MKKITTHTILTTSICLMLALTSCGDTDKTNNEAIDGEGSPKITEVLETGYPAGLTVKSFKHMLNNDKVCSGFIAIADTKANPKLKFNTVHQSPSKAPSVIHANFASKGKGIPYVTTNGGFFASGVSLSLLISDGKVESIENQSVPRTDTGGQNVTVYAVRSSFGQTTDGKFETTWIYCISEEGNKPYSFPSALDNNEKSKTFMPAPPTTATPGAKHWTPNTAIGGGPMVVKNGVNVAINNYYKEVFDGGGLAGLARHPRTAIGATDDGKLILMVCDGRGMNGSVGYTLSEVGDMMMRQGATSAINLDGGGSAAFVGREGRVLNKPSDPNNVERRVPTAVVISLME